MDAQNPTAFAGNHKFCLEDFRVGGSRRGPFAVVRALSRKQQNPKTSFSDMETTYEETRELFFKKMQKLSKIEHAAVARVKHESVYRNAGRVWVGKSDAALNKQKQDAVVCTKNQREKELVLRSVKSCISHSADAKASYAKKRLEKERNTTLKNLRDQKATLAEPQSGKPTSNWGGSWFGKGAENKKEKEKDLEKGKEPSPDEDDEEKEETEIPDALSGLGKSVIGDLPKIMNSFIKSFDKRVVDLDERVDMKLKTFDRVLKQGAHTLASETIEAASSIGGMFNNMLEKLGIFAKDSAQVLLALIIAWLCATKLSQEWNTLYATIGAIAVTFLAFKLGMFEFIVNIYELFQKKDRNVFQAGGIEDFSKFFVTACSVIAVGVAPPKNRMKDALAIFSHWSQAAKSTTEMVTWITGKIVELFKWIWCKISGKKFEEVRTGIAELDGWVSRVKAFLAEHSRVNEPVKEGMERSCGPRITTHKYHTVMALLSEGREMRARKWPVEDAQHVYHAISAYYNELDKVGALYHAAVGGAAGPRQMPLGCYFVGSPGSGKSSMAMAFSFEMLSHVHRKEPEVLELLKREPVSFVYSRPAYDAWWEGCRRDIEIVLMNEFGQRTDADWSVPYHETLNGIDTWPYHVPMAHLESKADMFIAPKIWLCTANGMPDANALKWGKALDRRLAIKYWVAPKQEYAIDHEVQFDLRKFDEAKIRSVKQVPDGEGTPWFPDVVQFFPVDFEGKCQGTPIDWDELMRICKDKYDKLERDHVAFIKSNMERHRMKVDATLRSYAEQKLFAEPQSSDKPVMENLGDEKGKQRLLEEESDDEEVVEPIDPNEATPEYKEFIEAVTKGIENQGFEEVENLPPDHPYRPKTVLLAEFGYENGKQDSQPLTPDELCEMINNELKVMQEETDKDREKFVEMMLQYATHKHRFNTILAEGMYDWVEPLLRGKSLEERHTFAQRLAKMPITKLWVEVNASRLKKINEAYEKFSMDNQVLIKHFFVMPFTTGFIVASAYATMIAGGVLFIVAVWKLAKWLAMKVLPGATVAIPQSDPKMPNVRRAKQRVVKVAKRQGADFNADQLAMKVVKKGQWLVPTEGGNVACAVTCLGGRLYAIPTHVVHAVRHSVKLGEMNPNGVITLIRAVKPESKEDVKIQDILAAQPMTNRGSDDLSMFMWTNPQVNNGPWIVDYFMSEDEQERYIKNGSYATIYLPDPMGTGGIREVDTQVRPVRTVKLVGRPHKGEEDIYIRKAYEYSIPTVSGHCGAIGVLNNKSSATKLFMMHAAGNPTRGVGYGTVVYREDIEAALKHFPSQIRDSAGKYTDATRQGDIWEGKFTVRNVVKGAEPRLASRTQIVESPFQMSEFCPWDAKKAPARLRPFDVDGVTVHPFLKAVSYYVPRMLPLKNFEYVRDCAFSSYVGCVNAGRGRPQREMRVLTFEEAVAGIAGDPYMKGIPRTTSAGYPLCLHATSSYPGKTLWFGKGQEYALDSVECQDLKRKVQEFIAAAEMRICPESIILDVLKDELLSLKKVEAGATRFISATPLVLLIVMRMYYGALSAYLMETRIQNGHAVGVNPYSAEWQMIRSRHEAIGREGYDGDAEKLDTSLARYVMMCLQEEIVFRFYDKQTEKEKNVRDVIWDRLFHSEHIFQDLIYEWEGCNPSGQYKTWWVNGETMKIGLRIAFCNAFVKKAEHAPRVLEEYEKHVAESVQGDDNFWTPSSVAKKKMTPFAVRDAFAQIGVKYTTADKLTEMKNEFKTIEQMTFLKREFRYEPLLDRCVSPLALDTIREMVLWHPRWDHDNYVAKGNVRVAMLELSQHSQETFDAISKPMCEHYLRVYGEAFPVQKREALLFEITQCTWDTIFDPMIMDQDEIGLLGSGASKGDGPVPRWNTYWTDLQWEEWFRVTLTMRGNWTVYQTIYDHVWRYRVVHYGDDSEFVLNLPTTWAGVRFAGLVYYQDSGFLQNVGMLGSGNSKGDGPGGGPKNELQELCVKHGRPMPAYVTSSAGGPSHNPTFRCMLSTDFGHFEATGSSKKAAEEAVALQAIPTLQIRIMEEEVLRKRAERGPTALPPLPSISVPPPAARPGRTIPVASYVDLQEISHDLAAIQARLASVLRTIEKNPGPNHGVVVGLRSAVVWLPLVLVALVLSLGGAPAHLQITPRLPIQGTLSVAGPGSPWEKTDARNHTSTNRVAFWYGPIAQTEGNDPRENAEVAAAPPKTSQGTDEMIVSKPGPLATIDKPLTAPLTLMEMNSTSIDPDLKSALGNWVKTNQGTIDSSAVSGTTIFAIDPLVSFIADSYITAKLTGYQGIRGTLIAKLAINANAFQQGRLLLVWVPQGTHTGMLATLRTSNLTLATQLPKAELDIATQSEATLEMPFVFPSAFHSFITGQPAWGRLALLVYSTYAGAAGGSTSYAYTLYVSFKPETVQLFNPTYMTVPQSGEGRIVYQSGKHKIAETRKGKSPAQKEKDEASGKYSGALTKVSNFASDVAKLNPDLAVAAEPLAWVAGLAAGVLKWFGKGAVMNTRTPMLFNSGGISHPNGLNCEEPVIGQSLGGTAACSVDVMPGFAGSEQDEMLFEYILQKSAYVSQLGWTTGQASGTRLFSSNGNVQALTIPVIGPPNYFVAPVVGYMAQFFGMYHGGLRFTFKFVKTPYHEGRLLIAYYPGLNTDPGIANSLAAHREWIDISAGNEFSFTTPFTNHSAYVPTTVGTGYLAVYIVNPLIAPASVAQSVTMLVEVSAAPGFEFAQLQATPYGPCIPSFSENPRRRDAKKEDVIRYQSADETIVEAPIAGAKNKNQGVELARLVVGERLMSVKQLMMMMSPIKATVADGTYYRPFTIGCAYNNAGVWANADLSLDYYAAFAPMYLYSRGGMRIGLEVINGSSTAKPYSLRIDYNTGDVAPVGTQSDVDHLYRWAYNTASMGGDVYVPGYNQNWARLNFMSDVHGGVGDTEPLDDYSSFAKLIIRTYGASGLTASDMNRGVADDYQAGFFLGAPPFASLPSNTEQDKREKAIVPVGTVALGEPVDQNGSEVGTNVSALALRPMSITTRYLDENQGPKAVAFPK